MARLAKKSLVLPELVCKVWGTTDCLHEQEFKRLQAISDALKYPDIVGGIFRIPWADSYAYYLVTSDDPLTLQHIDYGDAWSVPSYMIRGISPADVDMHLHGAKLLRGTA
jgi:hypothetical protein